MRVETAPAQVQTKETEIHVGPWIDVLALNEQATQAILSCGRQNGLSVGHRLGIYTPQQASPGETEPLIEVIELIGEDSAVGQILRATEALFAGARLTLIDLPCLESF